MANHTHDASYHQRVERVDLKNHLENDHHYGTANDGITFLTLVRVHSERHDPFEEGRKQDGNPRLTLATHFVDQAGAETTDTNVEQMLVYLECFDLFVQRNATYEDLWADYGWRDSITHVRSKSMRLVRKFWRTDAPTDNDSLLDDALDLVNYAIFFIRNYRKRNEWGRR